MNTATEQALEYKNRCLQIVHKYIESDEFDEQEVIQDCKLITRAHFEDIVQERACADLCGYLFCNNVLSQSVQTYFKLGQKYRIKNNKVYDITRRKNFCSDRCFNSADHLQKQINTEPFYMRTNTDDVNIELCQSQDAIAGDEVDIGQILKKEEAKRSVSTLQSHKENLVMKKPNQTKRNVLRDKRRIENQLSAPYLKEDTFNDLKDKFQQLSVQEKNVCLTTTTTTTTSTPVEPTVLDHSLSEVTSDSNKDNVNNNININVSDLSKISSDNIISPVKERIDTVSVSILEEIDNMSMSSSMISEITNLSQASTRSKVKRLQMNKLFNNIMSTMSLWITNKTRKLLQVTTDDENDSPIHNDYVFVPETDPEKKLEKYRWEYVRLCAKLDQEEAEEQQYQQTISNQKNSEPTKKKISSAVSTKFNNKSTSLSQASNQDPDTIWNRVSSFFAGQLYTQSNSEEVTNTSAKKVRFAVDDQCDSTNESSDAKDASENQTKEVDKQQEEKLFTPITESMQPQTKRKRLFLNEIQTFLEQLFDGQMEISELANLVHGIKLLVNSFHLTSENMSLSRKRIILVSILLLRLAILYHLIEPNYAQLFESNLAIVKIMAKFHLTTELIDQRLLQLIVPDQANGNIDAV